MKIDAVELTLFAWDDIPPTRYTSGSQNQSGKSNLALLRIKTDAGIEGNAFLGSATNPAETDAGALIRFLKPILMGKDPLAREELHAAMSLRRGAARYGAGTSPPDRRHARSTNFVAVADRPRRYASSPEKPGPSRGGSLQFRRIT
jgi:hypothetical protein